jgi:hypothetical protein
MNTDKRGLKTRFLSAFIGVYRRPKSISSQLLSIHRSGAAVWLKADACA